MVFNCKNHLNLTPKFFYFFFDKKIFAISHSIQNRDICKFEFGPHMLPSKKVRKKLLCSNLRLFACDDDINLELIYFLPYQTPLGCDKLVTFLIPHL